MQSNLSKKERSWVDSRDRLIERIHEMVLGDLAVLIVGQPHDDNEMSMSVYAMTNDEQITALLVEHASEHLGPSGCSCEHSQ